MDQIPKAVLPALLLACSMLIVFASSAQTQEIQLQPPITLAEGGSLATIAADLDQDGRDEYVDTVVGESVRIHDWHPSVRKFATTSLLGKDQFKQHGPRFGADIAVGDFNQDGFPDLILPDSGMTTGPGRLYL